MTLYPESIGSIAVQNCLEAEWSFTMQVLMQSLKGHLIRREDTAGAPTPLDYEAKADFDYGPE